MEKAKIALFEDNDRIRAMAKSILEGEMHTVVAEAATLGEAIDVIDRAAAGEMVIDVVFMDGKLREEAALGEDARIISQHIKANKLSPHVIGFSMSELSEGVCDTVVDDKDVFMGLDVIDQLPESS